MDNIDIFFKKCHDGNLYAVEKFLSRGVSPDVQNAEGETALQISAANGFFHIVKLLLKHNASVDLLNNYGWSPLMQAARHGHSEVVSYLIRMKAKVNVSNRLGLRPIDVAAWSGNLSCLKLIMDAGAIIDNDKLLSSVHNDVSDISPLMAASLQGHDIVLRTLLEKGSAVNQASSVTGLTSLMLAAYCGYKSIVEILIEFGADTNKIDICQRTALDFAVLGSKEDVIIFLEELTQPSLRKSSGGVPDENNILRVVRSGDILLVKSLLQQNQNLSNYSDPEDGVTPLMIACMLGFNNIADVLICNGADLNSQDITNGWTPLMYAVFHRQAETVHFLLDKKVDLDICTAHGYTALDLAIHADSSETNILGTLLAYSEAEELLGTADYLASSSCSTMKQTSLTAEKTPARTESQSRFKFLGSVSSHIRQFSKSSAVSPTLDPEVFDETLSDVFLDSNATEASTEGKFLCLSKFYAPNERFAHLLKEQAVEAIYLPPLPPPKTTADLMKIVFHRKDKASKGTSTKPQKFNSLYTPNLLRSMKKNSSGSPNQIVKSSTESLNVKGIGELPTESNIGLKSSSPLHLKAFEYEQKDLEMTGSISEGSTLKDYLKSSKENLEKFSQQGYKDPEQESNSTGEIAAGGLTALLNQESLKKYAKKFRDQEIDLECFQYLTEEDLDEMGISSFDSRHKLMEIIDKLKNKEA